MRIIHTRDTQALAGLLATRDGTRSPHVIRRAARIVRDVRTGGDAAVIRWARRFDDPAAAPPFDVSSAELDRGWTMTPRPVRRAIQVALRNIRRVAERQRPLPFTTDVQAGVRIEQRVEPLRRAGCYVPGGRYPLPSTVLMTVAPAVAAGVRDVVVACPSPAPAILCAALEAGATRVLRLGGAQAIAALAYGTESVDRVDKIVGPGNAWVAAAKSLVSGDCAVDMQAGPSEIVVCSDRGQPDWIAADLVAQAEHDPDARAVLVTTSERLARLVAREVGRQTPVTGPARQALARRGAIVISRSFPESVDIVNRLAPEHLVCDRRRDAASFRTAGTIFVGRWSAQAAGDYVTGSNHVLPTGGAGRFRGGLSTADFVRVFTVQTLSRRGFRAVAPAAMRFAGTEGLTAHANSIRIRL